METRSSIVAVDVIRPLLLSSNEEELTFKILKTFPFTLQFILFNMKKIECGDINEFSFDRADVSNDLRHDMEDFLRNCCALDVQRKESWLIVRRRINE